jgi:hypothetical protein
MVKGAAMKRALLSTILALTVFYPIHSPVVVTCPTHNAPAIYVGESRVDEHGAVLARLYYHNGHYFWVEGAQ